MLQQLGLQDMTDYEEPINTPTSAAEKVAEDKVYKRNRMWLNVLHVFVFTLSAGATGITNSLTHYDKIGRWAILLAIVIAGLVEGFYFTLQHGLRTVYQGAQRNVAKVCYRIIQLTMILNIALLTSWIVGEQPPHILLLWNHWSIAVHGALALIGVPWVSDSDWVIASRIRRLKAATDVEAIREGASAGATIVIVAAKVRGYLDAIKEAKTVLWGKADSRSSTVGPDTGSAKKDWGDQAISYVSEEAA